MNANPQALPDLSYFSIACAAMNGYYHAARIDRRFSIACAAMNIAPPAIQRNIRFSIACAAMNVKASCTR